MIEALFAALMFIAASFVLAGVQDLEERAISDLVWIPGIAGAAMALYWSYANLPSALFYVELFKLGMFSAIGVAFARLGHVGQADAIALVLIGADPYVMSFSVLLVAMVVAAFHAVAAYKEGLMKSDLMIPIEQFKAQKQWLPVGIEAGDGQTISVATDVNISREDVLSKAPPGSRVMVRYGLPVVTYISIGYMVYLAFSLVFAGGLLV
ncbi:MAG: hypothetical protein JRN62_04005 [Nitrososphaerota archaeon]|jgi:hypothetical protein|nr:hypothetical protein [Nitrososphaerota archaeon]MDG6948767.1 hypothetical protein [Nitrososphaerota archaeon]